MKRSTLFLYFSFLSVFISGRVFAQAQSMAFRYALVVGNANYKELGNLKNPGNDASDVAAALKGLGFEVRLLLDADLVQMEDAVSRLGTQLSGSPNSIGLFYYAGHGVQSNGINYLIPADAYIQNEAYLRTKALATQSVLDVLQDAGNSLNVVVLDACRDNPFGWARSGSRGLSVVGNQASGSIVVYATSAGNTAQDGAGRNGVFTAELLKNITAQGLEIKEVFNRTGAGVQEATAGKQTPAVYSQFFGRAYLAGDPTAASPTVTVVSSQMIGSLLIRAESAGTLYLDGKPAGEIRKGGAKRLVDLEVGYYELEIHYSTGERETRSIAVAESKETEVQFLWGSFVPSSTTTTSSTATTATTTSTTIQPMRQGLVEMVNVQGGTFFMGSASGESDEKPVHQVTLSSFMLGKYEVTQEQYQAIIGANPSNFTGGSDAPRRPVETVTWYNAVAFCNKLSDLEGLWRVYTINGYDVRADFSRNGYRLPTEAEWEYAARGGAASRGYTYSGSKDVGQVAWYNSNSGGTTHAVGMKAPNELGLYDMSGNVWEWCWDWYGSYSGNQQSDPMGASSGGNRVGRGGSWSYSASGLRSAYRGSAGLGDRYDYLGFRVLRCP